MLETQCFWYQQSIMQCTYATHQIEISLKGTKLRSLEIGREDLFGEGSHIDNMECSATTRPWNAAATLQTVWFHIKHFEQLSRDLLRHSSLASSRIVGLILLVHHHHGVNHCCCLLLGCFVEWILIFCGRRPPPLTSPRASVSLVRATCFRRGWRVLST